MKRILPLLFLSVLTIFSCGRTKNEGQKDSKDTNNSKIEFTATTFEFGKIAYGSDGTCIFTFKNVSEEPLVINIVRTTCGCTNPEWPKDPVDPGKTGEIKVKYNTLIQGVFQKSITVFSNAVNSPVKLLIKGEVMPDPETASSSKN